MEKENKKDQPNFECSAYRYMSQDWQMTQDVFLGLRSMNASSVKYLKSFHKESKDDYNERQASSELYNVFAGTINGVVGSVFSDGIVTDELAPQLKEMFNDIDLCGNDLESFLRVTFRNAVRDGHSFIFVDAPPPVEVVEGQASLGDVIDRRPFWVNYTASQAVNWQFEEIDGKNVLSQITFKEKAREKDGIFGEKAVTRYRVLRRGSYEIFTETKNLSGEIVLTSEGEKPTSLSEIPLITIYSNQTGMLESVPPYLPLLHTNIKHYNSLSKFDFTLDFVAPMPVFHVNEESDAKKFQEMQVAANRSVILWGEHADAKYLELNGASLEILKQRIDSAEMRMAKMGVEKYAPVQNLSNKTAFEVGTDTQKEFSQVAIMAKNLEDGVEYALYFTGELLKVIQGEKNTIKIKTRYSSDLTDDGEAIEFKLNIAYDKLTFSLEQLNFVNSMVDSKKLSLQTFWEWLPQVMKLPKGFSPETELQRLKAEVSLMSALRPEPLTPMSDIRK